MYNQRVKNIFPKILIFIILAGIIFSLYYFFVKKDINVRPNDLNNLIIITSPIKDSQISSPLRLVGRARGNWFFEGSFPVILKDNYGNTIASGNVTAQGEWMTEDFVPFLGTLQFNNYIKGSKGVLVFKNDNPSDDRSLDKSIEVPIIFK